MPVRKTQPAHIRFPIFCEKWRDGCGASICEKARKRVFARGTLPCDVLFTGEGPGEAENVIGQPFVGPAGQLLDMIIEAALCPDGVPVCSVAFTNLVCCLPRYPQKGDPSGPRGKLEQPSDRDVKFCAERLQEFVEIADPKLIVCVGALARDWLDVKSKVHIEFHRPIPTVDITHPSAILRANLAMRDLMIQKVIVVLGNSIQDHILGPM